MGERSGYRCAEIFLQFELLKKNFKQMKNSTIVLFLLLILSCTQEEESILIPICENCSFTCLDSNELEVLTNDCNENWDCNFNVLGQSTISLEEFSGIAFGDKNVFEMVSRTEGDSLIADDEFTNTLILELDANQSSFSVEDLEMEGMQVHYRVSCFCTNLRFIPVTSGCIQGEKQTDGTWRIQGHCIVPNDFRLCLLYTSPSPRDRTRSRMPSSA